ncbi:hypothetical protein OPW32_10450 [Vibrio europaeus]|uniref:hypothetical protein n=1 Tax=Vibrio europaeus TaxID=300876 RepID=UPI002342318C|nr:hypothetical protein [Vibrio europaeus]MDC5849612.1 hypothetical protein [Vibrio europaeus]
MALTLAMLLLSLVPGTGAIVPVPPDVWGNALLIVTLLCPWPLLITLRRYWQGQLIHAGQSSAIAKGAILRCLVLTASAMTLATFVPSGPFLVAGALLSGVVIELIYVYLCARPLQFQVTTSPPNLPTNTWALGQYYWPLAQSMVMLWGARLMLPLMVAALGTVSLAAWAAAWAVTISISNGVRMLQQLVIRHIQAAPDAKRLAEKDQLRRFSLLVGAGFSVVLCLLAFSPWGHRLVLWYLGDSKPLLDSVTPVLSVLTILPIIMAMQHYQLGLLMVQNDTRAIGRAALWSNLFIVLSVALMVGMKAPLYSVAIMVLIATLLEAALLSGSIKKNEITGGRTPHRRQKSFR